MAINMENKLNQENKIENKESKVIFDKIKSFHNIKTIFSYITEKKKLNIIIYNKKFQSKFYVDINSYKKISGRYIISEKNGKGKKYNLENNKLIFEGRFLNWKKNGIGKEYYEDGSLKFAGEYLNGLKMKGIGFDNKNNIILILDGNGMGKEYYDNGRIKFKGEYYNGKRWKGRVYDYTGNEESEIKWGKGKIKENDYYGKIKFEGEYFNGEKNGKGKEYNYNENFIYEGEYSNKDKNGKNKEYNLDKNLLIFEGEYLNGQHKKGIERQYINTRLLRFTEKLILDGKIKKLPVKTTRALIEYFNKNNPTNESSFYNYLETKRIFFAPSPRLIYKEYLNGKVIFRKLIG